MTEVRQRKGFTLLEVIIAMTLFSILFEIVSTMYDRVMSPDALGFPTDVIWLRADVESYIQDLDAHATSASGVFVYEGLLTNGSNLMSNFDHTAISLIGLDESGFLSAINADDPITRALPVSTSERGISIVIVDSFPQISHIYYIYSTINGSDIDHTLTRISKNDIALDIRFKSVGMDFSTIDNLPSIVDIGEIVTLTIPNPVDSSLTEIEFLAVKPLNYAISRPQF